MFMSKRKAEIYLVGIKNKRKIFNQNKIKKRKREFSESEVFKICETSLINQTRAFKKTRSGSPELDISSLKIRSDSPELDRIFEKIKIDDTPRDTTKFVTYECSLHDHDVDVCSIYGCSGSQNPCLENIFNYIN